MSKTGTTPFAYQDGMHILNDQSGHEEPEARQMPTRKHMLSRPLPFGAFGFTNNPLVFLS